MPAISGGLGCIHTNVAGDLSRAWSFSPVVRVPETLCSARPNLFLVQNVNEADIYRCQQFYRKIVRLTRSFPGNRRIEWTVSKKVPIYNIYKSMGSEWYSVVMIIIRNFYITSNRLRNELHVVFLPRIDQVRCQIVLKDLKELWGADPKSSVHMQSKLEVQSSVTGSAAPVFELGRAGPGFVTTTVYRQHRHFGSHLVTVALPCYFDHPDGISNSDHEKIQDFVIDISIIDMLMNRRAVPADSEDRQKSRNPRPQESLNLSPGKRGLKKAFNGSTNLKSTVFRL
ncbi:hypothetical protein EDD85DRAFT_791008 [Armillaria nabsnona]|nr:hypothetical protein EDD85DRAFT_791008 [Armillaria nabsnona]